jgi:hypothetical protein
MPYFPKPLLPLTPSKKKKKILQSKSPAPTQQGYYVLTTKRKKEFLITPKPLVKEQALAFGAAVVRKSARATFRLVPTQTQPVKIAIKGIKETDVFRMGFRLPVKKGITQPAQLKFIQRKPLRMGRVSEYKEIQAAKGRSKSIW